MAYGCYTSADLCAIRGSVITSAGAPIYGNTDGSAFNLSPVSLQIAPTVSTGDTFEQRDGCGNVCYTKSNADTNTGADLTLTLCTFDTETIALLTGAALFLDGSSEIIGAQLGTDTAAPVEFHAWTKANEDSSQVASPRSYWHHVFPKVTWTLGQSTLQQNALTLQLTGTASANANLGDGGFNDIPDVVQVGTAGSKGNYFYGWFLADDIPDTADSPYSTNAAGCGYVDTPSDDS